MDNPPAIRRTALALTLLIAALLPTQAALGRSVAGVEMPDSVRAGRQALGLSGMALYRKYRFPVLVAGLYVSGPERNPAAILASDSPRRYVTHFLRGVSAKRIRNAWWKGLHENTPDAGEDVRSRLRTLCSWIRDFDTGDELTVTYIPASGCRVEINGAELGVIPGKGFADAYFALALGPKPSLGKKFKARLLGG